MDQMDVIERIRKEHQDIDGMLQELSRDYDKQLLKKLKLSLTAHMSAEDGSLYAAMGPEHEMSKRAEGEHREIRSALGKFMTGDPSELPSKVSRLAEAVRTHVQYEEQDMLPQAQRMFDQEKIGELTYLFDQTERRILERAL
jgi:hemerythrin superfamily protein